jgi:hypothetical protein
MRHLVFTLVPFFLAACTHTHTQPPDAPLEPITSAPCSSAMAPLLVVDGVVQPTECSTTQPNVAFTCGPDVPIYVVDGVRTCRKP